MNENKYKILFITICVLYNLYTAFCLSALIFNKRFDLDEFEHTHVVFLIQNNQQIYVEFFEHHMPLYTEVLSSFFDLSDCNVYIMIYMRIFSYSITIMSLFLLFIIVNKNFSFVISAFSVTALHTSYIFIIKSIEIRPDSMSLMFIIMGICIIEFKHKISEKYYIRNVLIILSLSLSLWTTPKPFLIILLILFSLSFYKSDRNIIKWIQIVACLVIINFAIFVLLIGMKDSSMFIKNILLFNIKYNTRFSPLNGIYECILSSPILYLFLIFPICNFMDWIKNKFFILFLISMINLAIIPVPYLQNYIFVIPFSVLFVCYKINYLIVEKKWIKISYILMIIIISYQVVYLKIDNYDKNDRQIAQIRYINYITNDTNKCMDGWSGLCTFRNNSLYYWFLHDEIIKMIDIDKLNNNIIDNIKNKKIDLIIIDRYFQYLSNRVKGMIESEYSKTDYEYILIRNNINNNP